LRREERGEKTGGTPSEGGRTEAEGLGERGGKRERRINLWVSSAARNSLLFSGLPWWTKWVTERLKTQL
jgi:hypothetical protein